MSETLQVTIVVHPQGGVWTKAVDVSTRMPLMGSSAANPNIIAETVDKFGLLEVSAKLRSMMWPGQVEFKTSDVGLIAALGFNEVGERL